MEEKLFNQIGVQHDSWQSLRSLTGARIALGRTGTAIPLRETLRMKLARAHARDAVYSSLETEILKASLEKFMLPVLEVCSQVSNRTEYLQRPDLGRRLSDGDSKMLKEFTKKTYDVCVVLADGLSAQAINDHAFPVLDALAPLFTETRFKVAPICICSQARVAIADEIGSLLHARLSLILIGERPGLSSPNSMGAYITYKPTVGLTDESRNCVSNIRPEGLSYPVAANKIFYLVQQSLKQLISGVALKENHDPGDTSFLLA
jgi:ethanolamine ammonia-lyase small subunit